MTETNNSRSKAQTVSGKPSAAATAAGGATRLNQNNGLAAAAQQRTISNANNSHTGFSKKKTTRSRSELERLQESPGMELEWENLSLICRLPRFLKIALKNYCRLCLIGFLQSTILYVISVPGSFPRRGFELRIKSYR